MTPDKNGPEVHPVAEVEDLFPQKPPPSLVGVVREMVARGNDVRLIGLVRDMRPRPGSLRLAAG